MAAMAADEKTAMAANEHHHRATQAAMAVMAADEKTVMAADEHRHRAAKQLLKKNPHPGVPGLLSEPC